MSLAGLFLKPISPIPFLWLWVIRLCVFVVVIRCVYGVASVYRVDPRFVPNACVYYGMGLAMLLAELAFFGVLSEVLGPLINLDLVLLYRLHRLEVPN